jgi:arsenate reductase
MSDKKPTVAFICTHNSCRSQIAEALGRRFCSEVFTCFSAGTELKASINADALRLVKKLFDLDMAKDQKPKLLEEIPPADIIITMGCGVACPMLACKYREDWQLQDPTGKEDAAFLETIRVIEGKLHDLSGRIEGGLLN